MTRAEHRADRRVARRRISRRRKTSRRSRDAQLLVENGAGLETWLDRRCCATPARATCAIVVCADGLAGRRTSTRTSGWTRCYAKQYVAQDSRRADRRRSARTPTTTAQCDDATTRGSTSSRKTIAAQDRTRFRRSQRYMIVFHNAWQYYNDRFGITTLGFVEAQSRARSRIRSRSRSSSISRKQHHVHAVFSEPEYSPKLAAADRAGRRHQGRRGSLRRFGRHRPARRQLHRDAATTTPTSS